MASARTRFCIHYGGERLVRRHAGTGERIVRLPGVDLLGLQLTLGLGGHASNYSLS